MPGVIVPSALTGSMFRTPSARRGSAICMALWILCASGTAQGDPVIGEVFSVRQPDGTTAEVRLWGDEFYHIVESMDGYTLMRESDTGRITYARLSQDGNELVSTDVLVQQVKPAQLDLQKHIRMSRSALLGLSQRPSPSRSRR